MATATAAPTEQDSMAGLWARPPPPKEENEMDYSDEARAKRNAEFKDKAADMQASMMGGIMGSFLAPKKMTESTPKPPMPAQPQEGGEALNEDPFGGFSAPAQTEDAGEFGDFGSFGGEQQGDAAF